MNIFPARNGTAQDRELVGRFADNAQDQGSVYATLVPEANKERQWD